MARVDAIMLGVHDVDRAKKFYVDGMGATIEQDFPGFCRLGLGEGASSLALYGWEEAAKDAGVSSQGSGFRGFSLHYLAESREEVDEAMTGAVSAGGSVIRPPHPTEWGGYEGYFADPDGHLWKVATAS